MLVRAASKSCNLLLNIGPQPNGELPAASLDRLQQMGAWMARYGTTIDGTVGGPVAEQSWGVSTMRGNTVYLHVLDAATTSISVPLGFKPRKVTAFDGDKKVKWTYNRATKTAIISCDGRPEVVDYIIQVER